MVELEGVIDEYQPEFEFYECVTMLEIRNGENRFRVELMVEKNSTSRADQYIVNVFTIDDDGLRKIGHEVGHDHKPQNAVDKAMEWIKRSCEK